MMRRLLPLSLICTLADGRCGAFDHRHSADVRVAGLEREHDLRRRSHGRARDVDRRRRRAAPS